MSTKKLLSLSSLFFGLLSPAMAFAGGNGFSVTNLLTTSSGSISSIVTLALMGFGMLGIILVGMSLYGMYQDHKNKQPMGHRFSGLLIGSSLLIVSVIIGFILHSVLGTGTGYSSGSTRSSSTIGFSSTGGS